MELSPDYLNKFKIGNTNPDTALADMIYIWSGKQLSFPLLMRLIKTKGRQFIYESWNETRQSDANDPIKLFLWRVGQTKIIYGKEKISPA